MRGGGCPAGDTFAVASGLSLTGILFPLLQPMFEMVGQPAIRQQCIQGSRVARGDARIASGPFRRLLACGGGALLRLQKPYGHADQAESRKTEKIVLLPRLCRFDAEVGVTAAGWAGVVPKNRSFDEALTKRMV